MCLLFHITLSFVILTVLLIEFSSDKILTQNSTYKQYTFQANLVSEFCIFLSKHFANIRKQGIWGNKYIKVKGQSLLFNNWIDSCTAYRIFFR
jgi:hypothetical protein